MHPTLQNIIRKEVLTPAIVGAASFAAGFATCYFIKNKEGSVVDEEYSEMIVSDYTYNDEELDIEDLPDEEVFILEPELETRNVFEHYVEQWNWEDELLHREGNTLYTIHYNEFVNNESNYNQETLTYYAGDDILTDQLNTPIYDYQKMTGPITFGHGSNDKNVVFIRNELLHIEWEILKDEGKYQDESLIYEIEKNYEADDIKHSNNFKFRED